ncbi:MAG TPA: 23S rRNA (adenine(2030)-N(6))-methyltransferase RlmJ [Opitutaceae bacterium]
MGVNYRHAYHAGNHADVFKHALLVRLVRSLQKKEAPFLFVDTHAGRGRYDLSLAAEGDSRSRAPEWPDGIGRLWDRSDAPAAVLDYLKVVRGFDRAQGNLAGAPRYYPGSPRLVREIGRPADRLELWEKHPDECAALRSEFKGERRVAVHEADGYGALRACLPPRERRALVLVDPPFESQGEWASIGLALAEGMARLPGGTYAAWYPLTERAKPDEFLSSLRSLGAPSLCAELLVDAEGPGLRGSGVVVVNPPWQFEGDAGEIADYLSAVLSRGGRPHASVRWIVPR